MKNFKNTFIIGVITLITLIIFSQIFKAYSSTNNDTNTYLSLIKGKATINDTFITVGDQKVLVPGDLVRTIGKQSLAVIEWGDGSITRLGGNTKISVGNNEVSRDYTKIDISFDLIAGKTWSNVVSFISSDSSFTQSFRGVEAGVRGTVFDVDLEKLFLHVSSHEVELRDSEGRELLVSEDTPFSLDNFTFIEMSEFISNLQDIEWANINQELDTEVLSRLKIEIESQLSKNNPFSFLLEVFSPKHKFISSLQDGESYDDLLKQIDTMSQSQKSGLYSKVLSLYQNLDFVTPDDDTNYSLKLLYKRVLLTLANDKDKERLLETTLHDFKDTISSKNIPSFNKTLEVLNENSEVLKKMDIERFFKGINLIPDDLEKILRENFKLVEGFFEGGAIDSQKIDFSGVSDTVDSTVDNTIQDFSDIEKKATDSINKGLDTLFEAVVQ